VARVHVGEHVEVPTWVNEDVAVFRLDVGEVVRAGLERPATFVSKSNISQTGQFPPSFGMPRLDETMGRWDDGTIADRSEGLHKGAMAPSGQSSEQQSSEIERTLMKLKPTLPIRFWIQPSRCSWRQARTASPRLRL
jgi:hypothetical protein